MSKNHNKKILTGIVIAIYIIITAFVGINLLERVAVKQAAEAALLEIKQGPDGDTMKKVVDSIISDTLGNGFAGSYLMSKMDGESIKDIYSVLTRRMEYKVTAVQMTESGVFKIGVIIGNNNNIKVGEKFWELVKERYLSGGDS